jgi:hypothetical protein
MNLQRENREKEENKDEAKKKKESQKHAGMCCIIIPSYHYPNYQDYVLIF